MTLQTSWRHQIRAVRWMIVLVAAAAAAHVAYDLLAKDDGLFNPSGHLRTTVVVVAVMALALRAVALFVVPPMAAYRLVLYVLGRLASSLEKRG